MNGISRTIIVAGAFCVGAAVSAIAGPAEERQELMKSVGDAVKVAVPMAKGEAAYDAAAASKAMRTIGSVPDKFVKLFPKGSETGAKTEASPKIWEDMKGFLAKAEDLKTASAAAVDAAAKGQDAFKAAVFGSLLKSCKGCHDAYRIKKN